MSLEKFERVCRMALIVFAVAAVVIVLCIGSASGAKSRYERRSGQDTVRTVLQADPIRFYVPDSMRQKGGGSDKAF